MKLNESPLLPSDTPPNLRAALSRFIRDAATKINQMAAGSFAGKDNAATAMPTTGTWAIGDFVTKSNPVVAGGGGSQYVITGWLRITNGTGNVLNTDWVEARVLTGT
jgi:hypothetical protein